MNFLTFPHPKNFRRTPTARRRGMSLIEMLLASAVMAMIATAIGALAMAVSTGSQYGQSQGEAVQHARVALDRIEAACRTAYGNEHFPGYLVVPERIGTTEHPHTLIVWRPGWPNEREEPADPAGMPRYSELVIFTPDPGMPSRLLEVTAPNTTGTFDPPDDLEMQQSEMADLLSSGSMKQTPLTDLLRTADAGNGESRGAVRFDVRLRPSDEDLAAYRNEELDWSDLPWAQSVHGGQFGLRQASTRIELQLTPREEASAGEDSQEFTLTFFGSATIYYGIAQ